MRQDLKKAQDETNRQKKINKDLLEQLNIKDRSGADDYSKLMNTGESLEVLPKSSLNKSRDSVAMHIEGDDSLLEE